MSRYPVRRDEDRRIPLRLPLYPPNYPPTENHPQTQSRQDQGKPKRGVIVVDLSVDFDLFKEDDG